MGKFLDRRCFVKTLRRALCGGSALFVFFLLLIFSLDAIFPFPREWLLLPEKAVAVKDRHGKTILVLMDGKNEWNVPVGIDQVNAFFKQAIVSAEDKNFYRHRGVDWIAVLRALGGNITGWRRFSGASTITMQTIRLLNPRPRTLSTKIMEAFRAWQIERLLTKEQILEVYLNRTPYGGNLIGIEAASRKYFDKHAYGLDLNEASILAGIPQSPTFYLPERNPKRVLERQRYVLKRMAEDGHIARQEYEERVRNPRLILSEKIRLFRGVHFAYGVKNKISASSRRTTLDLEIQALAEKSLEEGLKRIPQSEVSNGAVAIIENENGSVVAMVGSNDFFSRPHHGQVNGARARRSPGSLLKPFTYALAFEKGIAIPDSVLLDTPFLHPQYSPENYDRGFRGPLPARVALRQSLNVPAVRLQEEMKSAELLKLLRAAGLRSLSKDPSYYGLSLTLGSGEVSLLEIVEAYCALARLGSHIPLRFLETAEKVSEDRVLSKEAAFLVAEILRDVSDFRNAGIHVPIAFPRFAWKTGTSGKHRDAWTVIYNPKYTIGVWLGNFSGKSSSHLVGIESAAPIAFDIFARLVENLPDRWYDRPEGIRDRKICPVSGDAPRPGVCESEIEGPYIEGKSREYACRVHVKVAVDEKTGHTLCPFCLHEKAVQKRFEIWDDATLQFLKARGDRSLLPSHNPRCEYAPNGPPRIILPPNATHYSLEERDSFQYVPMRAISPSAGDLYWFENGNLIGRQPSHATFFHPLKRGKHEIRCVDTMGKENAVTIFVK